VHEDEAATGMARASAGGNIFYTKPNQGKVNLLAKTPGLLKVNADVVKRVNLIDDFIVSTKPNNTGVRKGELVGSVKIVPLTVDERRMRRVEKILTQDKPILEIIPPRVKKIGVIITGTEVYEGRVKDAFEPALGEKLAAYGLKIQGAGVVPDDEEKIKKKILAFKEQGHKLILVAGGMAVDAGDVTPAAIRKTGAEILPTSVIPQS